MEINYSFKKPKLYELALVHPSYANEHGVPSNQRLEFVGDSVLSCVVAGYIYKLYPGLNEGGLTELRAKIVCEASLAEAAKALDLGEKLQLGKSEEMTGGGLKPSILADTFESVLGAIYFDGGFAKAEKWALAALSDILQGHTPAAAENYKSALQEFVQEKERSRDLIRYVLKSRTGPDHIPTFNVAVTVRDKPVGAGSGNTLKSAEQNAARDALEKMRK